MLPLFEMFPELSRSLPYVRLCELPTPVLPLHTAAEKLELESLYIKQDGLTARPFGGNKVRKLEFLLGEANARGAKEVLTYGYAGSNHALATAVHCGRLGMKSISMLMHQENARYVRQNLLFGLKQAGEFHVYPDKHSLFRASKYQTFRHFLKTLKMPVVIPPGGSSPLGVTGYVNAALELKQQIDKKELPEPDLVYLPMGTAGTLCGLKIGFAVAGLKSQLIPIRVVDHSFTTGTMIMDLLSRTVSFLRSMTPEFPELSFSEAQLGVRDQYLGKGYTHFTEAGTEAALWLSEIENIMLDGTYTAKAFSALMDDGRQGKLKDKTVLYWHTLNAFDFSTDIKGMDYKNLPRPLHRYFEQDVQQLDVL